MNKLKLLVAILAISFSLAAAVVEGELDVTTAGVAERITTTNETYASWFFAQAKTGNTDTVYIGFDTSPGVELEPGDTIKLDHTCDLSKIYFDSDVNGEGFVYWYEPR